MSQEFDHSLHPTLTLERVGAELERHEWRYARTMPKWPHFYTLREHWTGEVPFENIVQFMRDTGYRGHFNRTPRLYWRFGEWKYWSMGAPLAATILINRDDWWRNYSKVRTTMDAAG